MTLSTYCVLRATIQMNVPTDDLAGGQTASWVTQGSWSCRMETLNSKEVRKLGREGHELVQVLQGLNGLPARIQGYTKMHDLLRASSLERIRLVVEDRYLTIIGIHLDNNGNVGPDVLNINVVDYTRPTGFTDKA